MSRITTKGLLLRIFIPTTITTLAYLVLGHFIKIPHLLLFCISATVILMPMEIAMILSASKKEYGTYSLQSAFNGQEKLAVWKTVLIASVFFGIAGLLSTFVAPLEGQLMEPARNALLEALPKGFDWSDYEYLKATFSTPMLIFTCVYYLIFNVFVGPITEELFFRGYLTSHYKHQNSFTPILIAVLFSLYHFWLPFANIFRILVFAPATYVAYKKKNIYIIIIFHCLCNLISTIFAMIEILG
ncbi:MAG: CPBP family intramembrane glutamic endopeptidase [Acutalibacteraceae bacterium]|nr:CPBP family intramembrane glutamic endopeptidase [Acutalibacteraceae bacterium]